MVGTPNSDSEPEAKPVLGTTPGILETVAYYPLWFAVLECERHALLAAPGEDVIAIQHVGSTSIEGMDPKPTLDILAGVRALKSAGHYQERLGDLGYQFRSSHLVPGRLDFAKITGRLRTHNLSLTVFRGEFWDDHLLFWDHLRARPKAAAACVELKRTLAQEHSGDAVRCTQGKDRFIKRILHEARRWRP
jgi:GrpB-like predicted nucleotidyltransferase (UPF0157 family)